MDPSCIFWSLPTVRTPGDDVSNVRSRLGQTRVMLIDMPQMLREIICELVSGERDLEIVGEFDDEDAALQAIDGCAAAVVIRSLNESARADIAYLLSKAPHLRVLAVSGDGRASSLYVYRPHEQMLGEISPRRLLAAIRDQLPEDLAQTARNVSPC